MSVKNYTVEADGGGGGGGSSSSSSTAVPTPGKHILNVAGTNSDGTFAGTYADFDFDDFFTKTNYYDKIAGSHLPETYMSDHCVHLGNHYFYFGYIHMTKSKSYADSIYTHSLATGLMHPIMDGDGYLYTPIRILGQSLGNNLAGQNCANGMTVYDNSSGIPGSVTIGGGSGGWNDSFNIYFKTGDGMSVSDADYPRSYSYLVIGNVNK